MSGKRAFVMLAFITSLGVLASMSTAWSNSSVLGDDRRSQGGWVMPCSLNGVNPAYHLDIFGSPAVARSYGFVRSPDGAWHVERNCVRGPYHN
jgi:hypothetical protein